MSKTMGKKLLLPVLLATLVLTFIFVQPVHADDGTPIATVAATMETTETPGVTQTPTPTIEATEPVTPAGTSEAADVTETPAPMSDDEADGAIETPVPTVTESTEGTPASTPTATETTDEVLGENDISGSDENSDPAGDSEVAEINGITIVRDSSESSADGDPYFTVGSVTYRFYATGSGMCGTNPYCFEATYPLQAAIDYMANHNITPTDRKLYIEAGTYDNITSIDATKGGLAGLTGLVGKGNSAESVHLTSGMWIAHATSGFSVSNLSIDATTGTASALSFGDCSGTITLTNLILESHYYEGTIGLVITDHTGNVIISNLQADGNSYWGAYIVTQGSVIIKNSSFNKNLSSDRGDSFYDGGTTLSIGLVVAALGKGSITLDGVSITDNSGDGAYLYAPEGTVTVKNSVVLRNNVASDGTTILSGWGDGLYIYANTVNLENINSSGNALRGIVAYANNSVTGVNLTTENNYHRGMDIYTCLSSSWGACENTGGGIVILKKVHASGNGNSGIAVYAKGTIYMYDATANSNYAEGIYLINNNAASVPTVSIYYATAEGNNKGIVIYSRGVVTGMNLIANGNNDIGLFIHNKNGTGSVIVSVNSSDPQAFNEACYNGNNGYEIYSNGAITITNLDAYWNGDAGGYIDNSNSASGATVTIKVLSSGSSINSYELNGGQGLTILSHGLVTISNVVASYNADDGIFIDNQPEEEISGNGVTISNSRFNYNCVVDEHGDCEYTGAGINGLQVETNGAISLQNITAIGNDGDGVMLDNQHSGSAGAVTIKNTAGVVNYFSNNYQNGLTILTNGSVSLAGIAAVNNGGSGLEVDNSTAFASITIKSGGDWYYLDELMKGNIFLNNSLNGLNITSNGAVSVFIYQAIGNGESGINIDADGGKGTVTVSGIASTFSDNVTGNDGSGIEISASGNVVLNYIDSNHNSGWGADLENSAGVGGVTINNGYFDENEFGLLIVSNGAIKWTNGSASKNDGNGATITGTLVPGATTGKPISVINVSTNGNGATGLSITSVGSITLTNVASSDNSYKDETIGYGDTGYDNLDEQQQWSFSGISGDQVTVEINSDNFDPSVVIIDSNGTVIGTAEGAAGSGLVTLTVALPEDGVYSISVSSNGLDARSYTIDLYTDSDPQGSGTTLLNDAYGIYINNSAAVSAAVKISNTAYMLLSNNSAGNLYVESNGAISVAKVNSRYSGDSGIVLDNAGSSKVVAINLVNVSSLNNDSYGVYIRSAGSTNLSSVDAYYNGNSGVDIASSGSVNFTNVDASKNGGFGATVMTNGSFTLKGKSGVYSFYDYNTLTGLLISANGTISISQVYSDGNGYYGDEAYGISIDSRNTSGSATVSLSNVYTSYNTLDGLNIETHGNVIAKRITSSDNDGYGLAIDQTNTSTVQPTTSLQNITAERNGEDGINVIGKGNISLAKFYANENSGYGVYLDNTSGLGGITISNPSGGKYLNEANNNGADGVALLSNGAVSVTGLEASNNTGNGLAINNSTSAVSALVKINSVTVIGNELNGLLIESLGYVTVINGFASSNGNDGINIYTRANALLKNTTSINNDWEGMRIFLEWVTDFGYTLTLSGCGWYANLIDDPNENESNLDVFAGKVIIL